MGQNKISVAIYSSLDSHFHRSHHCCRETPPLSCQVISPLFLMLILMYGTQLNSILWSKSKPRASHKEEFFCNCLDSIFWCWWWIAGNSRTPYVQEQVNIGSGPPGSKVRWFRSASNEPRFINTVTFDSKEDSPTLVMVHGYAASQGFFFRNFDALASRFKVIAVDQLGYVFIIIYI